MNEENDFVNGLEEDESSDSLDEIEFVHTEGNFPVTDGYARNFITDPVNGRRSAGDPLLQSTKQPNHQRSRDAARHERKGQSLDGM